MQDLALHRTIVVVDIAGFTDSSRTMAHQLEMQRSMYKMLYRAFAEADIDLNECEVEDRGDGMMILLPPEVPKNLVADRLPGRLVAGLKRYNALHSTSASVQLRVGLHAGEVSLNEHGAVSPAINLAFRILDAGQAKEALRLSNEVLAIIASDPFYQDVIFNDPGANPDRYRKIPVEVKKTSATAWLMLPDGGMPELPDRLVRDLLSSTDLDHLHQLLTKVTGVDIPNLVTLMRRASGLSTPTASHCVDAWDAFTYLLEFNAGDDGIPPALKFVQLLTRQVANPLRAQLTEWIANQAQRLRLEPALRIRDQAPPVPAGSRLHLLIMVQHDGIDKDRFLLSYWRQDDPDEWPPVRGETLEVSLDELERKVDELIVAAEQAWSSHGGTAALEFLLPRALLGLPVHRWNKEYGSGFPRQLCMDYPVVVRSLERMKSAAWHRVWRERWGAMAADPSPDRILFCQSGDLNKRSRLDAILASPQWTLMVLTGAPPPEPLTSMGEDELTAALRAGIPALIWHPEVSSDGLRDMVSWLVKDNGLGDLPARTRASRLATYQDPPPPFDADMARDLVVLWDDPARTVILDQASGLPARNVAR